jgi:hypothetical protein
MTNVWDFSFFRGQPVIYEAVVYDNNSNSIYDAGEPVIVVSNYYPGSTPAAGDRLNYPRAVIAGVLPEAGASLKDDPYIKYVCTCPNFSQRVLGCTFIRVRA